MVTTTIGKAALAAAVLAATCGVAAAQQSQDDDTGTETAGTLDSRRTDMTNRILQKETTVAAPPAEVWRAWTTVEGVKSFFGDDAQVELALGGKYEIYFDLQAPPGSRGSEGCRVLAYLPEKMLAFTWNAPPSIPALRSAGAQTQVVLQFEELAVNRVRLTVSQHGFGNGDDWEKYYAYFDRAWDLVLSRLQKQYEPANSPEASPPAD